MKKQRTKITVLIMALLLFALPIVAQAAGKTALSKKKVSLVIGQTYKITLKNNSLSVKWSNSNKKIASMKKLSNNEVQITAKKKGSVNIIAKVGKKKYTCKVSVKENPKLTVNSITLNIGETLPIKITGASSKAQWSITNKKIATLQRKNQYYYLVKAKKIGNCFVRVKVGKKKLTCKVMVRNVPINNVPDQIETEPIYTPPVQETENTVKIIPISSVIISKTELTSYVGQYESLSATISPANTTEDKAIRWSSSDDSIAIVNNGFIVCKKAGTVTVTAAAGSKSATCTVTVNKNKETLRAEAKTEYEERVQQINSEIDAKEKPFKEKISELGGRGYYAGSYSSYTTKHDELVKEVTRYKKLCASCEFDHSEEGTAKYQKYKKQLTIKEAELKALDDKWSNKQKIELYRGFIETYEEDRQNALNDAYAIYQDKIKQIDQLY